MAPLSCNMNLVDILDKASMIANPNSTKQVTSKSTPLPKRVTAHKGTKTLDKPTKKRTWKKPKGKPKRPLSAYNLFFQSERERIVHADSPASVPSNLATNDGKKKRRNRKSHGKIGFADLARGIAEKWKKLDDESKSPFEARAAVEKRRYKAELEAWKKSQESKGIKSVSIGEQQIQQQQEQQVESNSVLPLAAQSCDVIEPLPFPFGATRSGASARPSFVLRRMMHKDPHGMGKPLNAMSLQECLAVTQRTIEMATAVLNNPILPKEVGGLQENSHHIGSYLHHSMQQTFQSVQQDLAIPTYSVSGSHCDAAFDFPDFHLVEEVGSLLPTEAEPCMSSNSNATNIQSSSLRLEKQSPTTLENFPTDNQDCVSLLDDFEALDEDFVDFLTEFEP